MRAAFTWRVTAGGGRAAWTPVALAPVPTSDGGFAMTTSAATTAEPDQARPPANQWGVGSRSDRGGFAIRLKVVKAAASEPATTSVRYGQPRHRPTILGAMSSRSQ